MPFSKSHAMLLGLILIAYVVGAFWPAPAQKIAGFISQKAA